MCGGAQRDQEPARTCALNTYSHATLYMSSYYYICVSYHFFLEKKKMEIHSGTKQSYALLHFGFVDWPAAQHRVHLRYTDIYIYLCPHTTICVLILLYMCPHTTTCPHTTLSVSSYYYLFPHTTIYVSSYYFICPHTTICVCILLYLCPHTTPSVLSVSSYRRLLARLPLYMCPHTGGSSLYMCPHTGGSSRDCLYICVLIQATVYMCVLIQEAPSATAPAGCRRR